MELKERLNVSAEAFFDAVVQSVVYDAGNAQQKTVTEADLKKGYSYKKTMKNQLGQKGNVLVTIDEFERPVRYAVSFESRQGRNCIDYQVTDCGDGSIVVYYREDFAGSSASRSWNYRLLSGLYRKKAQKRVVRMLHAMETYIKNGEKNLQNESASSISEREEPSAEGDRG